MLQRTGSSGLDEINSSGMNKKTKAEHSFKKAGIPISGFHYQELIGIELLLSFFRNPDKYRWVELDSEDPEVGSLDDVVAARGDGSYEVIQVKFTPDPDRYFLDWDWLLEKKPNGTSLLFKWAESLNSVASLGSIHSAKLRTNRRPDTEFQKSLMDGKVDISRIDEMLRERIENELGGPETASDFFSRFLFSHSEPLIDQLENWLRDSIVPTDTDNSGWLLLCSQARRWATRKQEPEPDGKIRHQHLVQIITKRRAQPISQDFRIPDVYCQPSTEFHEAFLRRVETSKNAVSVLWGTPGRGKSTYLSFFVEELHRREIPSVRHHYFLSLDDTSGNRLSFFEITTSLIHQMETLCLEAVTELDEQRDSLRKWLEACGNYFKERGKPFVVIIDGLDHVWRECGDIVQMQQLFAELLPASPNVHLVVGTQKVSQDRIPSRLIRHAEDSDWVEIPPMSRQSVYQWMAGQHEAGRLRLPDNGFARESGDTMDAISEAFFEISQGHPLHLIYSFEALVRRGVELTPEEICLLPECPEGDINKYYGGLWSRLSPEAKQILHLIAGSDFHWPPSGIMQCVGPIDEVAYLLEHRRSGLVPFHGSILAYVRELPGHEDSFHALLPEVTEWLEQDASEYLRWGWLWLIKAMCGDYRDLLNETTREWVVKSLADGWPEEQIIAVLGGAEQKSFADMDYAKTIGLRHLKFRVIDCLESQYQTERDSEFLECALRSGGNDQRIRALADGMASLKDKHVLALARSATDEMSDIRYECSSELWRRINLWIDLGHRPPDEFIDLVRYFFAACSLESEIDIKSLLEFIEEFYDPKEVFNFLVKSLSREKRVNELISIVKERRLKSEKAQPLLLLAQDALVCAASAEGVDIASLYAPAQMPTSPLLACWLHYHQVPTSASVGVPEVPDDIVREHYSYKRNEDLERFFCDFFFHALANRLRGSEDNSLRPGTGEHAGSSGWIYEPLKLLDEIARNISEGKTRASFSVPYRAAKVLKPVAKKDFFPAADFRQYQAFRHALCEIAVNLHCLNHPVGKTPVVEFRELAAARESVHWSEEMWISFQLECRLRVLEPEEAERTLCLAVDKQDSSITPFNDRTDTWIELAQFALLYGLQDACRIVRRAADCMVGYGWRKDYWLAEVLDMAGAVHEAGAEDGRFWLEKLVPIVEQAREFTDGYDTDYGYFQSSLIDVMAKVCPERLPELYSHCIANNELDYAAKVLSAYCGLADFTDAAGIALARTFIERRDILDLRSLAEDGDEVAELLGNEQVRFLGGLSPERKLPENDYEDLAWGGTPPDVGGIRPSQFRVLVEKISDDSLGHKRQEEILKQWLVHWKDKGKGIEAMNSIRSYFEEEENPHTAAESLLDDVFQASLALEGKRKAYEWLVRAHIHRHGWRNWYASEEEVLRRLGWAAEHYPERWADFIRDTSEPAPYWQRRGRDFAIGAEYLVRFLLMVGQKERAADFVDICVRLVAEEVSDQPTMECQWFR